MKKPKPAKQPKPPLHPFHSQLLGRPQPRKPQHHHRHPHHGGHPFVPAMVRQARHKAAVKAAKTRAAKTKKAKKRQLTLADGVACCAAEALAASLRLTGHPVTDADVLALYQHTADGPDAGASILATLEAAAEYGLAGVPLLGFEEVMPSDSELPPQRVTRAGLVLGVDLPGPHTVLADGSVWWSWGELYDPAAFADAVVEEAWEVVW